MNFNDTPQKRPGGGSFLVYCLSFFFVVLLPTIGYSQFGLNFQCSEKREIDATLKGTSDSTQATIMLGDTTLLDSMLVELALKGDTTFWGPATIITSAGQVVVIPKPGIIPNTGSAEEASLYRAWIAPASKVTAFTPVTNSMHYDDWQSMTIFSVQHNNGGECLSGSTSGGDLLIYLACDSLYFNIDTVSAPTQDVRILTPLSEIGDADTNRVAIIWVNYVHNGIVTTVSKDTFDGNDNIGPHGLLFNRTVQVPGNVDSIFLWIVSPNNPFSSSSCTNFYPYGGDSFVIGTVVVSSSCDNCCTVEADCAFPDIQVCSFDSIPGIPEELLDSMAAYSGNVNLDSLAYSNLGGSYFTTQCDTVYIVAKDDTTGGSGCGLDTAFVTRTFLFYNVGSLFPLDTCRSRFIVLDDVAPSLTCPDDVTVECTESTEVDATGTATATDNCSTATITYTDVLVLGACPQNYTILRTWYASDACGNMITCVQTINVMDSTPPSITCPADTTLECTGSTDPANTGFATATDNCDVELFITYSDTTVPGACAFQYTILRTWRATDACSNVGTCIQTINVVDTTAPEITCPANVTLECPADIDPGNTGLPIVSDNCDMEPFVTYSDMTTPGDCPQEYTITRTWSAEDACGNVSTCLQTINVVDTTPPVISCPADITVQCVGDIPPPDPMAVSATDACQGPVEPVFSRDVFLGNIIEEGMLELLPGMSCPIVISRIYSATDDCGNSVSCTQTIVVNDTIPPSLTCPADATVSCETSVQPFGSLDEFLAGGGNAFDNCSLDTASFTLDTSIVTGICPVFYTFVYSIADLCGNVTSCTHNVTVIDTVPPSITCADDLMLQCIDDLPPALTSLEEFLAAGGNVTDNCALDSTRFALIDETSDELTCPETITRTYQVADLCGNIATCVQTIVVHDTIPPTFDPLCQLVIDFFTSSGTSCPADANISLMPGQIVGDLETWTVDGNLIPSLGGCLSDNCTATLDLVARVDSISDNMDSCNRTIITYFTILDQCGNESVDEFVCQVNVHDDVPPSITCPVDVSVECDASTDPASTGEAIASDDCQSVSITYADVITPGECPQAYTITRTWSAADACGNVATCIQTISVDDTTPPMLTCPPDGEFNCMQGAPFFNTYAEFVAAGGSASDNCALDTASFTLAATSVSGMCPLFYSFLYTITDECGNLASCVHSVTVTDEVPPSITCPDEQTFQCIDDLPPALTSIDEFVAAGGNITDNCSLDSASFDIISEVSDGQSCPETITRTYQIADFCGNVSTCIQTIIINDTIPPTFNPACQLVIDFFTSSGTSCPADANISLMPGQIVGDIETWTVDGDTIPFLGGCLSDNCTPTLDLVARVDSISDNMDSCNRTIITYFTILDLCGNESVDEFVCQVNVHDDVPPSITCPDDVTVQCDEGTDPLVTGEATATDDCQDVTITYTDVVTPGQCPQAYTITRMWTAADACGNVATCFQSIDVVDTTPPMISCPQDLQVECTEGTGPMTTGFATASDNCDPEPFVTYADVFVPGECINEGIIIRTWTATDACGNLAVCAQTVTVTDSTPPDISCPADVTVECDASTDPANTGFAIASDACDPEVTVTYVDVTMPGECPQAYTIVRTWYAADACGNQSSCTQHIDVQDTTPPTFNPGCQLVIEFYTSAGTSCPADANISLMPGQIVGDQETWTVDGDTIPSLGACLFDNCTPTLDLVARVDSISDNMDSCNRTIITYFTILDQCGNESVDEFVCQVNVHDDVPPSITCPLDVTVDCALGTDPANTGEATATDECQDVTITYADVVTPGQCAQSYSIMRMWTAADACGNVATCVQTINVLDTTPPSITCPADVTVICGNTDPDSTGFAIVVDRV